MTIKRHGFAHGRAVALAAALVGGFGPAARAEVHIEGSPTAVRVTASHDAIADVLAGLAAAFKIKYRVAAGIDAMADGTYSGSIRQVLSHLLDGYNYVIKSEQETFEIVVFDKHGTSAIAPQQQQRKPPFPARARGLVSQWR
jgi:hypothetical protein